MKLNNIELKIGQWWRGEAGDFARILNTFDDRIIEYQWNHCPYNEPDVAIPSHRKWMRRWTLATPQQLSSAGIADDARLCEQSSEWEGVELWDLRGSDEHRVCWFSIDESKDSWIIENAPSDEIEESGQIDAAKYEVTTDPRYAWVYSRPDVLAAVKSFRAARDAKAGVLKWECVGGDWYVVRRKDGRTQYFGDTSKEWHWLTSRYSEDEFASLPDATPAQIAQSGVPLEDVPEPMREEVRKLREPKPTLPVLKWYQGELCTLVYEVAPDQQCRYWRNGNWRDSMMSREKIMSYPDATPEQLASVNFPIDNEEENKLREPPVAKPEAVKETRTPFDAVSWPLGAWLRWKRRPEIGHSIVTNVERSGIYTRNKFYTWHQAVSEFEITADNGKSWHPCIRESLSPAPGGTEPR